MIYNVNAFIAGANLQFSLAKDEDIDLDTGNDTTETETQAASGQPSDGVNASEVDIDAGSQAKTTDELEVYVDEDEGGQKTPNMSQREAYAAFRKEQDKRKKKQREIDAKNEENKRIAKELEDLKKAVYGIQKGSPPTLKDCGYDEHLLNQKMAEYHKQPSAPSPEGTGQKTVDENSDEASFYLYRMESELSKAIPNYEEMKDEARDSFMSHGIEDTEGAMLYLSDIAMQGEIDIAKVTVAIRSKPSIIKELQRAGNNQIAISKIMEKAADSVKTRKKAVIDTQPEPKIDESGPSDVGGAKVLRARKAWVENPTKENHAAYRKAKNEAGK